MSGPEFRTELEKALMDNGTNIPASQYPYNSHHITTLCRSSTKGWTVHSCNTYFIIDIKDGMPLSRGAFVLMSSISLRAFKSNMRARQATLVTQKCSCVDVGRVDGAASQWGPGGVLSC